MVKFRLGRGYQSEFGVFLGGFWENIHPERFKVESELIRTSERFRGHFAFYSAYRTSSESGMFDAKDGVSRKLLALLEKLKLAKVGIFVVHYKLKPEFAASDVIGGALHAAAAVLENHTHPSPALDFDRLPPEPRPLFRSDLIDLNRYDNVSDFSCWSENEHLLVDLPEEWIASVRCLVAPQISVVKILQVAIFLVERRFLSSWAEIREYLKKNADTLHIKLMMCKKVLPDGPDVVKAKRLLTGLSLHAVRRTSEVAGTLLAWARDRLGGTTLSIGETSCKHAVKHAIFSTNGVQTVGTDVRVRPAGDTGFSVRR